MASFTGFRSPRSSRRGRHLCAPSSVSGPDGGCRGWGGFSALMFAPKENGTLAFPWPYSARNSKMYSNQVLAGARWGWGWVVSFPHAVLLGWITCNCLFQIYTYYIRFCIFFGLDFFVWSENQISFEMWDFLKNYLLNYVTQKN